MTVGYFHRVAQETPTRVWVNNPTGAEIAKSIEAGAVACTTNPSYCSRLIALEGGYINKTIDEAIEQVTDNSDAAERAYHIAAQRVMHAFLPIYETTHGAQGYVTIQGDPRLDKSYEAIADEAMRCTTLGPNYMAKIPVTKAGLKAIECLVEQGIPVCATEIFSISQAVQTCEAYRRASERTGQHPPFFVTHITGIFDQLFEETVKKEQIEISLEALQQAGSIIARKEYQIIKERGYQVTLMGGGARSLLHFTGLVGGDLAVTLNWTTMEELIAGDGQVRSRIGDPSSQSVVDELCRKLPNFLRAYEEQGLAIEEYEDFGPVVLFRTMFLNGYTRLLDAVADRRHLLGRRP